MPVAKGAAMPQYTPDQRLEIAKVVCDLYESQETTIESCCEAAGVSYRLFRYWSVSISEISELYKKAKARQDELFFDRLKPLAKSAMEKLLEGQTVKEVRTSNVVIEGAEMEGVENRQVIHKELPPNPTVTIFAMKGEFPDKYADRTKTEATVTVNPANVLTAEQEAALAAILKQ